MHDYLLSTEWVRFAFVCGIAVSMLLYERRHLTTGSIVVPGYIAVFLLHPLVLVATFLNSFATYAIVNKVLRRYVLLYGRTKFTVLAVVSTLIQTAMLRVSPSGPWLWENDIPIFVGVGYIVPALIAHDMARQGIAKTTKSVLLAGALVAIPIGLALAVDLPGVNDLSPVDGFGQLAFPVNWLPIAVIVSIVASWAVAHNYDCRSGGFIGAALVGMFLADIWQVATALVIATLSYLVVAKLLMRHMILFGRRKFSAMLLTSSAIAWPALWIGNRILDEAQLEHVGVGSLALTPLLLPGLLANDLQRTAPARVAFGVALAGMCTVTLTWWVGATLTGQHLELHWKAVAVAATLVLVWPQAAQLATRLAARLEPVLDPDRRAGGVGRIRAAMRSGITWITHADRPMGTPAAGALATGAASPVVGGRVLPSVDWSASWAKWAQEHPEEFIDAQRWLQDAIDTMSTASRDDVGASVFDAVPASVDASGRDLPSVDWSASWAKWAHAHADEFADAQAWLQDAMDSLANAPRERLRAPDGDLANERRRDPVSVGAAPSTGGQAAERTGELEGVALTVLSRLLERSPAPVRARRGPTTHSRIASPDPLPGTEASSEAPIPVDRPAPAHAGLVPPARTN